MNPILKTIREGEKTFKMFVPEDDGSASDWFSNYTIAMLKALIVEEEGRKFNHPEGSCYNCNCKTYDQALKESIKLKEDIIKELEKNDLCLAKKEQN